MISPTLQSRQDIIHQYEALLAHLLVKCDELYNMSYVNRHKCSHGVDRLAILEDMIEDVSLAIRELKK